jgi:hypothetical protein
MKKRIVLKQILAVFLSNFMDSAIRRKCLMFLFAALLSTAPGASQPSRAGAILSSSLFSALQDAGLRPEKQYLTDVMSDGFPFNVIIRVPGSEDATLAFIASEDAAISNLDDWLEFLRILQTTEAPVSTEFVFTANDTSPLPAEMQAGIPAGTRAFIESVFDTERLCAIVLENAPTGFREQRSTPFVVPGHRAAIGANISAPLWLSRSLPFPVFGTFLSLYRLNLLPPNARLNALQENGIPSAAIIWNPQQQAETDALFAGLQQFIADFQFDSNTDFNYSILPSSLENIVINESTYMMLYMLIAALCVLFLCLFSVVYGKSPNHIPIRKSWFALPPIVALTTAGLFYGQSISAPLFQGVFAGILLPSAGKILFVFILFSILHIICNIFFHINPAAFATLLILQSALNVLVFGLFDAEALLLFAFEFTASALLLRGTRRLAVSVITALVLVAFYIPSLQILMAFGERDQIAAFLHGGVFENMVLACIIVPFMLLWCRIQAQFSMFLKQRRVTNARVLALTSALTVIIAVSFFAVAVLLSNEFAFQRHSPAPVEYPLIMSESDDNISLDTSVDVYFEQEIVQITASADLPIIRVDITLTPLDGNNRIYSDTDFQLPEYPPNPLVVSYIAGRGKPVFIEAVFFLFDENNEIIRQKTALTINAETGEGRSP